MTVNLPTAAPLQRLSSRHPLGRGWSWLLDDAADLVRPGADPWVLHPVDLAAARLPDSLPAGPAIYGAIGWGSWQYAGQTIVAMRTRLRGHRDDGHAGRRATKHGTWQYLMVLPLAEWATPADIGRTERAAKRYLRPRTGERWARG